MGEYSKAYLELKGAILMYAGVKMLRIHNEQDLSLIVMQDEIANLYQDLTEECHQILTMGEAIALKKLADEILL